VAHTLIDQLLAAPYEPPSDLLRQIVEAGETTVEPLLVALRELDGLEQDLSFVVALLGSIQNKAAVPDLTQVAYRPDCNMYEIQNGMAFGLARMGEIDALLTIAADDTALLWGHHIFIRDSGVKNYLMSSYLTKLVA
jgi:hypothetical protein